MTNDQMPKLNKQEFVNSLKVAKERIDSAEILLKANQYRDSISRSYYACFDIISALLGIKGLIAKTHAGSLQLFGLHFVKTGIFDKKYAKIMRELLEKREMADYERQKEFSKEETINALEEVKDFVRVVESSIENIFNQEAEKYQ